MLPHTGQGPGWQLQRMPNRTLGLQLQLAHRLSWSTPSYTLSRAPGWQLQVGSQSAGPALASCSVVMAWQTAQTHWAGHGLAVAAWSWSGRMPSCTLGRVACSLGKAHDCTAMPKPVSWSLRVECPDWPFYFPRLPYGHLPLLPEGKAEHGPLHHPE